MLEGDLFLRYLEVMEMYRECLAKQQNREALVKYREQVCQDLLNQSQSTKAWWKLW